MIKTFESLDLSEQLMGAIHRFGYKEPTQIQRDTIPLILQGKDIIGESATGSGKTLAFGAGIIEKCNPDKGIQALVLVPTRELAEQVKDEIIQISYKKSIRVLAIYGGVSIIPQIKELRRTDVVIATPGRLLDHLNRRTINTSKVKMIVLDEADRMVEMGFIEDVEKIIKTCPKERQTLIFSATMHGPAQEIAKKYMKDPVVVHATKMVDPSKLKQSYYDVPSKLKNELLIHLLQKEKSNLVMVFCNTRRDTDVVVEVLKDNGVRAAPIHGGLAQVKRLKTIELFHRGQFQVLVCTDVAARGLHIEGVTHIYNYDIPKDPGDYIHRIGRTARAGKKGLIINILSYRDYDNFSRLTAVHKEFEIQKEERPYLKAIKQSENPSRNRNDFHNKRNFRRRNTGQRPQRNSMRGRR
ncbi:MAG: DEAD/DEAH box helicase [Candidatus Woesearchaeota archaeon]